jgi:hypothetical protein
MLLNVEADTPESAQGETEARPNPAPRAKRANEIAAATTAPAAILAQETAESDWSDTKASVRVVASTGASFIAKFNSLLRVWLAPGKA